MNKSSVVNGITADFLAARTKTTAILMGAIGWQHGCINPEYVGVDSVFFYVFDQKTKWIWSCSIPRTVFFEVIKSVATIDHTHAVAACKHCITAAAASGESPKEQESGDIAIALISYIGKTETYRLTKCANLANHFFVIYYGASGSVRPFAMTGPARHLLDSSVVVDSFMKVQKIDAKNHPEWM